MSRYPQPQDYAPPPQAAPQKGVIGIVSLLVAWVPVCGMAAIRLAGIGLIVAVVGFIVSMTGVRSTVGMSVVGGIICLIAIVVPVVVTGGSLALLGKAAQERKKTRSGSRQELTENHPDETRPFRVFFMLGCPATRLTAAGSVFLFLGDKWSGATRGVP